MEGESESAKASPSKAVIARERESYIESKRYCKPCTNKMFKTESTLYSNLEAQMHQTDMESTNSEIWVLCAQCMIQRLFQLQI